MHPWFDIDLRGDIRTEASFPDDVVALQLQVVPYGLASCIVAATTRGIRWSNDGARSWQQWIGDSAHAVFESVLLSPRFLDDQIVHGISNGVLVVSGDAGRTWQPQLGGSQVLSMATASTEKGQPVIVAGTETDGVLRSCGAQSWESINAGLLDLTIVAMAMSPQFARDRTIFLGTPTGLYRSRNGGNAWRELDLGLMDPSLQVIALSPDYADNGKALVGTESDGLFVSNDWGRTWRRIESVPASSITALACGGRGHVAVADNDDIWISTDSEKTWQEIEIGKTALSLAFVYEHERTSLLIGLAQGGVRSSSEALSDHP